MNEKCVPLLVRAMLSVSCLALAGCSPMMTGGGSPLGDYCISFSDQTLTDEFDNGEVITSGGHSVGVDQFQYGNGVWTEDGDAKIDNRRYSSGSGLDLNARNVNLDFVFPVPAQGIFLQYGELGGNVNLEINGDFQNAANLSDLNGATLGGVAVAISETQEGNNRFGVLALIGSIDEFSIGGQELWIDNVCIYPLSQSCAAPDIEDVPIFAYNEALSTILRGIEIEDPVASQLGIAPGYYRIRHFRVWTQPDEWVITLNILKVYAEIVGGPNTLPTRDEEWVFSIIEEYEYNNSGFSFTGYDLHGHRLSFRVNFGGECQDVERSTLDCLPTRISTQGYIDNQLNSCGWSSEPGWTIP